MELVIRNTTNQPIYDQIYSQIKAQIIAGKLSPGEALPSIRALAKDLRISVITTKRAYDELEADGFLFTVAGKGCFVAEKNLDLIREQKLKELEDHLDAAVELAAQCGVSSAQLQAFSRLFHPGPDLCGAQRHHLRSGGRERCRQIHHHSVADGRFAP